MHTDNNDLRIAVHYTLIRRKNIVLFLNTRRYAGVRYLWYYVNRPIGRWLDTSQLKYIAISP